MNSDGDLFKIQNKILTIFFNLSRKNSNPLGILYHEVLEEVKQKLENIENNEKYIPILIILYKLIGYTRDIVLGRGERELSYKMLLHFHNSFPVHAMYCLYTFTTVQGKEKLPYGSWRDIPGFCQFVKDSVLQNSSDESLKKTAENHPAIMTAIGLMNNQIDKDRTAWNNALYKYLWDKKHNPMSLMQRPIGKELMSLAVKWTPREDSKYGWLYDKMVSTLNKQIDSVEICQCANNWSKINPINVPLSTMTKQKNAFLNITANMEPRKKTIINGDRIDCSMKFKHFLHTKKNIENICPNINTQNGLSLEIFANIALKYIRQKNDDEFQQKNNNYKLEKLEIMINTLNEKWEEFSKNISGETFIPIIYNNHNIDNSYLSLACLLAKKSKGLLLMRKKPIWLDLSECRSFVETIEMIYKNYYENIDLEIEESITNSFEFLSKSYNVMCQYNENSDETREPKENKEIKFVIISNLNISEKIQKYMHIISSINHMKIIYWNISDNLIDVNKFNNMIIVSGVSKSLVKHLLDFSYNDHYNMMCHILKHPRYDTLGKYIENVLCQ